MLGDAYERSRGMLDGAYDRGHHALDQGQDVASRFGRHIRDSIAQFTSSR